MIIKKVDNINDVYKKEIWNFAQNESNITIFYDSNILTASIVL